MPTDSLRSAIEQALRPLTGLKLSVTSHAGNMRRFGFGELKPRGEGMISRYSLHVQCPWRVSRENQMITGSSDWYEPNDENDFEKIADESWDPSKGGSLQETRLRMLFNNQRLDVPYVTNETDILTVVKLAVNACDGFELLLSPDYVLTVFPASSRGEQWRLFQPGRGPEDRHFVVESSSAEWT